MALYARLGAAGPLSIVYAEQWPEETSFIPEQEMTLVQAFTDISHDPSNVSHYCFADSSPDWERVYDCRIMSHKGTSVLRYSLLHGSSSSSRY